jgi:hypothetical protein
MGEQEDKVMCARAPECLRDGFIHPGEDAVRFNGKLYHRECAERQEAGDNTP